MIKQDYLLRMIQEIISMLVEALLYRKKLRKEEWTSYDSQLNTLLGMPTNELMALNADDLISRYAEMQDGMNKLELSAVTMLKPSDEMGDEHLLQKSRLRQEGLILLKYIQEHSDSYSMQRALLINLLDKDA